MRKLTNAEKKKARFLEHKKQKEIKEYEKLTSPIFGNSISEPERPVSIKEQKPYRRETKIYKSVSRSNEVTLEEYVPKKIPKEEYEERERLARIEKDRKKKRVAVLFNKGAYQYICDTDDPRNFGK